MKLRLLTGFVLSACVVSLVACGSDASSSAAAASPSATEVKLQGAGASFPAPLYSKWFKTYSAAHQNVLRSTTSRSAAAAASRACIDHTVDFGASDAAMKPEDMAKVDGGVQLFPMTAGSIVLAYNLQGRRPT